MQLLRASDYRRTAWKNGGGETAEIAVYPPDAGLADFVWRISMATVSQAGPFSVFPMVDRTLCVLAGGGLELVVGDAAPRLLTQRSDPFAFPGDVVSAARPVGGTIVDLNVMTRRDSFGHQVRRIDVQGTATVKINGAPCVIVCAKGRIAIAAVGVEAELEAFDSVTIPAISDDEIVLRGDGGALVIALCEISSKPR